MSKGSTYLVGEQGPELLTMGSSGGHVTNARDTRRAMTGSGGGVTIVVQAGPLGASAPSIQRAVVEALRGWERRHGAIPISTR